MDSKVGCSIIDVNAYLPEKIVTNEELCSQINSTDEWIRRRTGVEQRRYGGVTENPVTMAVNATRSLASNPAFSSAATKGLILSSVTHDTVTPSAASFVCAELDLTNVAALDIQAACAGFPYALELARSLIVAESMDSIIVVASDKLSDWTSMQDRSFPLVGDAAAAVLVSRSETAKISRAFLGSDARHTNLITTDYKFSEIRDSTQDLQKLPTIIMDGPGVFRWTLGEVPSVIENIVEKSGYKISDIDVFIPHQANIRITEALVKLCGFRSDVIVADSVRKYGNTLSASLPLALFDLIENNQVSEGSKVLMVGFGSGMIYGGQVVTL